MNPFEKFMFGVVSRPSKRLNLFAELKLAPNNSTDLSVGCRTKFAEAMITSQISTSGKASTVYRKFIDSFELSFTAAMDITKPNQPATFGMTFGLGGM